MSIPTSYKKLDLVRDTLEKTYFEVDAISPAQLRLLTSAGAVSKLGSGEGLQLYVTELHDTKFRIKTNLDAYILLYNTFKGKLKIVNSGSSREVTTNDLFKFII